MTDTGFPSIQIADPLRPASDFRKHLADCLILTHDGQLYLQKRPEGWSNAGGINLFGGHVESGETPQDAVIREIHEETGGRIVPEDLVFIATVTESWTDHSEAVHVHFWHDRHGSITGCYECEPATFATADEILSQPNVMDYTLWAAQECRRPGLIL